MLMSPIITLDALFSTSSRYSFSRPSHSMPFCTDLLRLTACCPHLLLAIARNTLFAFCLAAALAILLPTEPPMASMNSLEIFLPTILVKSSMNAPPANSEIFSMLADTPALKSAVPKSSPALACTPALNSSLALSATISLPRCLSMVPAATRSLPKRIVCPMPLPTVPTRPFATFFTGAFVSSFFRMPLPNLSMARLPTAANPLSIALPDAPLKGEASICSMKGTLAPVTLPLP